MMPASGERHDDGRPSAFVPIVCCVDDRFVLPLCVLMESIVTTRAAGALEVLMIVINDDLSEAGRSAIMKHADLLSFAVQLRTAPPPSSLYPQFRWDSNVTYTRLAIPEVIPDHRV